jgi:hypothetical protein
MNLTDTRIGCGLTSIVRPTRPNRSGLQSIGTPIGVITLPASTKIYRMKSGLKPDADGWSIGIRFASNSEMVSGGDGKDAEGVSIDMPTIHGFELRCLTGAVNFTMGSVWKGRLFAGDVMLLASPDGNSSIVGNLQVNTIADNTSIQLVCAGE